MLGRTREEEKREILMTRIENCDRARRCISPGQVDLVELLRSRRQLADGGNESGRGAGHGSIATIRDRELAP